jgi:hypothetical protein
MSRNTHQIMFQVIELAVALWFPCCLWNCIRPEQLWILNPRKILKRDRRRRRSKKSSIKSVKGNESDSFIGENENDADDEGFDDFENGNHARLECWICYDNEKDAALMQPCNCKGDVSAVHHECLKQWLMESHLSTENIRCQVCKQLYNFSRGKIWLPAGLSLIHYLRSALILSIMGISFLATYVIIKHFEQVAVRTMSVGVVILIQYICLRCLGVNLISAYQRAKFAAIQIRGRVLEQNEVTESESSEQHSLNMQSTALANNGFYYQFGSQVQDNKNACALKGKSDRMASNEHRQKLLSFIRATLNEQLSHEDGNFGEQSQLEQPHLFQRDSSNECRDAKYLYSSHVPLKSQISATSVASSKLTESTELSSLTSISDLNHSIHS